MDIDKLKNLAFGDAFIEVFKDFTTWLKEVHNIEFRQISDDYPQVIDMEKIIKLMIPYELYLENKSKVCNIMFPKEKE